MKRVIERCPNCGVEHDDPKGGTCEVCGTPLRYWCRVHSKEIGWLDAETCPRCAAEAARPAPPPRAPAPPPPRTPATPPPAPPLRPRRSPHPEPPLPSRVEPDYPAWSEVPAARDPRPTPSWGGRDPRVVIREGAEDLAPYAEAGATMAVRMVRAFFAVVGSVIGWGVLGAAVGFFFPGLLVMGGANPEPIWTAMAGAMVGGGVGLFIGTIRALRILFAAQRPPER